MYRIYDIRNGSFYVPYAGNGTEIVLLVSWNNGAFEMRSTLNCYSDRETASYFHTGRQESDHNYKEYV